MNFIRKLSTFLQGNRTNDARRKRMNSDSMENGDNFSGSSNIYGSYIEEENIEMQSTTSINSRTLSSIESLSTDLVSDTNQIVSNESRITLSHSVSISQLDQPKSMSTDAFINQFSHSISHSSSKTVSESSDKVHAGKIQPKVTDDISTARSTGRKPDHYKLRNRRRAQRRSVRFSRHEEKLSFATPEHLHEVASSLDINQKVVQEDIRSEYAESLRRSEVTSFTDTTELSEAPNELSEIDELKTYSATSLEFIKEQVVDSSIAVKDSTSATKMVRSKVGTSFEGDNSPSSDIVSIKSTKESPLRRTIGSIDLNAEYSKGTIGLLRINDSSSDIARDSPTTDLEFSEKLQLSGTNKKTSRLTKTNKSKKMYDGKFEISEKVQDLETAITSSNSFVIPTITRMSRLSADAELVPRRESKKPKHTRNKETDASTFIRKTGHKRRPRDQDDGNKTSEKRTRRNEMTVNEEKQALENQVLQKNMALHEAEIEKGLTKISAELAAERQIDDYFRMDIDAFQKAKQEQPQTRVALMNYNDVIYEKVRGSNNRSTNRSISSVFATLSAHFDNTIYTVGGSKAGTEELEELIERFGVLKHKNADIIEGQVASQVSIVPELKCDHPYKVFGITKYFTFPVSLRIAEAQFRDLRRGNFFRMYQDHMDWVDIKRNFCTEHTPKKFRKQLHSYLMRLATYGGGKETHILSNYYFFSLMLADEINIGKMVDDFSLMEELGPVIGLFIKIFSVIFLDTPLTFYILTVAGISRFGYLKFFDCMPLIRGFGYGMFLIFIVYEGVNSIMFDLGLRCLSRLIANRNNWLNCTTDANGGWTEKCISFPTNTTHNNYCPVKHERWNGTENFASQNFIRYMMTALYSDKTQDHFEYIFINCTTVFVWAFIFGVTWSGYKRTKRFLSFVHFTVQVIIIVTIVPVLISPIYLESKRDYHPFMKLLDIDKMHHILRICIPFLRLPYLVWIASMMPSQADPEVVSFVIMSAKLGWSIISYIVVQICIFNAIKKYKINSDCFTISHITMIYGLIPDFYSDFIFGSFASALWLCLLNLAALLRMVYVLQSAVVTTFQFIPVFRRFSLIITGMYCSLFISISRLHYVKSSSDILIRTFRYELDSCIILMYAMFLLGLTFLYSYQSIQDDYAYVFKKYPYEIWKLWLNVAAFMSFVLIGFIGILEVTSKSVRNVISILFTLGVLLIGVTFFLHHICTYICIGHAGASIRPLASWFDPQVRGNRKFFFSNRNIRVRSNVGKQLSCGSHICLGQSRQYIELVLRQRVLNNREDNQHTKVAKILSRISHNEQKQSSGVTFTTFDKLR